jgi:hypothetical protein
VFRTGCSAGLSKRSPFAFQASRHEDSAPEGSASVDFVTASFLAAPAGHARSHKEAEGKADRVG